MFQITPNINKLLSENKTIKCGDKQPIIASIAKPDPKYGSQNPIYQLIEPDAYSCAQQFVMRSEVLDSYIMNPELHSGNEYIAISVERDRDTSSKETNCSC